MTVSANRLSGARRDGKRVTSEARGSTIMGTAVASGVALDFDTRSLSGDAAVCDHAAAVINVGTRPGVKAVISVWLIVEPF